jgi:hypothetical protein
VGIGRLQLQVRRPERRRRRSGEKPVSRGGERGLGPPVSLYSVRLCRLLLVYSSSFFGHE